LFTAISFNSQVEDKNLFTFQIFQVLLHNQRQCCIQDHRRYLRLADQF